MPPLGYTPGHIYKTTPYTTTRMKPFGGAIFGYFAFMIHIFFLNEVTGTLLLLIMHILYSSAFDSIRWGKFELFWYNHHLFIAFYFITLLHGEDYWNPNFVKCHRAKCIRFCICLSGNTSLSQDQCTPLR